MPTFTAEQISGPTPIVGTADFYFSVTLPDGAKGHAVVGIGDATQGDDAARQERVAAALNFQVEASSYDEVVQALTSGEALSISLTGFLLVDLSCRDPPGSNVGSCLRGLSRLALLNRYAQDFWHVKSITSATATGRIGPGGTIGLGHRVRAARLALARSSDAPDLALSISRQS